jgi:5'-nucleotidase (lipoprotein e(P4) family)
MACFTSRNRSWLFIAAFLAVGAYLHLKAEVAPIAPAAYAPESPAYRGLDANLFMQTSAEYRACCLQAYNLAALKVEQHLVHRGDSPRPPAVIMDLDETVFDNGGFQAAQVRSRLAFDPRLFEDWERGHAQHVGLIPGSKRFIERVRKQNVTVFFVSNRQHQFLRQARASLALNGIPVDDDTFLKLNANPKDGNKTDRWNEIRLKYDVLLMVGDNLRDFDERFKCGPLGNRTPGELRVAIEDRKARVDEAEESWGERWIILPNPAYGEWTKPLGRGIRDQDLLAEPERN